MAFGFHSVRDLETTPEVVLGGRYGTIQIEAGLLTEVRFRPFPKRVSIWETRGLGAWRHRGRPGDRCQLYFNQPRSIPDLLALIYVESTAQSTLRTIYRGLEVLDQIARLKGCDAIVSDVSNQRISDRMLERHGWVRHCLHLRGRHFIKRFSLDNLRRS